MVQCRVIITREIVFQLFVPVHHITAMTTGNLDIGWLWMLFVLEGHLNISNKKYAKCHLKG